MSYFKLAILYILLSLGISEILYAADGDVRAAGKFISDTQTGQPPLEVNSTTIVHNLNTEMLGGMYAYQFAARSDGYVSFPMRSLDVYGVAEFGVTSNRLGLSLADFGFSIFGLNIVVPGDAAPGTHMLFDVQIYNPIGSTACQAVIEIKTRSGYRPGAGKINPSFVSAPFPAFLSEDSVISHRSTLLNAQADDAINFLWQRDGMDANDNCGEVHLVGVSMHYQKQ